MSRRMSASRPFVLRCLGAWSLCCLGACSLLLGACSATDLPVQPPLADMEEPLDLLAEPDDEAERQRLPAGTFSGLTLADARDTLAAKLDEPALLRITEVIENSPADAAGLQVGDVLIEVKVGDNAARELRRPSEWRELELETPPGTSIELLVDRAGREASTKLQLTPRVRPAPRERAERWREEDHAGVVLRTATEAEARAAGLGPGGGAVIVGLSGTSPWRSAGLRFGDLLTAVDGAPVAHPQDVLAAVRRPGAETLHLEGRRGDAAFAIDAALSQRDTGLNEITVPLLFYYEADRGRSEWSVLLGIVNWRGTAAAWRFRLFWLFAIGGGDEDRLLEVDQ